MEDFILAAKDYFEEEEWNELDKFEQLLYGKIFYIYFECLHLNIKIQIPEFMLKKKIPKNNLPPVEKKKIANCKNCKKSFTTRIEKKKHLNICKKRREPQEREGQKQFLCEKCHFSTDYDGNLKRHIRNKHMKCKNRFKCDKCPYTSYFKNNLLRHMKQHNAHENSNKNKQFQCFQCERRFESKSCLAKHFHNTHLTSKTTFKCGECDYIADTRMSLVTHIKIHKTSKTHLDKKKNQLFHCSKCDTYYSEKITLNSHYKAVHLEIKKKYKCNICPYSTQYKCNLKTHRYIHASVKPFKCQFCEYECCQSTAYKKHLNSKHHIELVQNKK